MLNIIIPTYKARETLPRTLDSLVAQTKKMFMVTICQDGDDEDYSYILDEYRKRGLHISLLKSKTNRGPGMARQMGIDASGMCDYIMFVDADDILMPRAVEILYAEAKAHDADMVISSFIADKKYTSGIFMDADSQSVTWCHGKIYKRKYLVDNNIRFNENIRYNEDSFFNLVAANCTKNKLRISECMYIWTDNKNSITRKDGLEQFFMDTWNYYILSQVCGINKIIDVLGYIDPILLAATLLNIYYHHMQAKYYRLDESDFNLCMKTILNNKDKINEAIKDESFWIAIVRNLKGACEFENNIIFFEQKFNDWLKMYVLEEIK